MLEAGFWFLLGGVTVIVLILVYVLLGDDKDVDDMFEDK